MAEVHAHIRRQLGATQGDRVQMLARVGHGPEVRPSPRWPVEAKLDRA